MNNYSLPVENGSQTAFQEQRPNSEANAKRLANLRPFPKGVSGNPGGRPKGQSLTAELRRQINQGDNLEKLAQALLKKGLKGDIKALMVILDRLEGDVRRSFEVQMQIKEKNLERLSDEELITIIRSGQAEEFADGSSLTLAGA